MSKPKSDLHLIRHTAEHVLTQAMEKLYPNQIIKAMGPATDEGFYFDFETKDLKISQENFAKIEKEMQKIIDQDLPLTRQEISVDEAKKLFADNSYKQDWINQVESRGEALVVYWTGKPGDPNSFVDFCLGPHLKSTAGIKAFKLLSVAGAYWHGDEKNQMLTRIYGTAFASKKELDQHLFQIEEAQKRDHRKLGQELELFTFDPEVGIGLPLWLPNGARLRQAVMDYASNVYLDNGYEPVSTPHLASSKLWQHSGHVDFYKEGLYGEFSIEDEKYRLKPMNCPFHVAIYKFKPHSYRDLPMRLSEMGTVYRYERSGVLHGLTRVRGFTQDDAHIICTPEDLSSEVKKAFNLTLEIFKTFGFTDFEVNLSTRDKENKDKFIGSDKNWQTAEKVLREVIKEVGYGDKYVEDIGGAVFYGPKIDIKVADSIGRKWQLSTIQFDFNLPERFDMTYVGSDGQQHVPYMIHRALLGSLERFIGVLIEHYGGAFPLWLSPVQVSLLPISEKFVSYAQELQKKLKSVGIRVKIDNSNESLGKKIRQAEEQKTPYMLILGQKELDKKAVSVRQRGEKDLGQMTFDAFVDKIQAEINQKLIS